MSLVPTWVEAVDGNFYKDPTLRGTGWFVCFDDDDPPELVIRVEYAKKRFSILKDKGIKYANLAFQGSSGRLFGGRFKTANSYFFKLRGPIPIPDKHDGVASKPTGQCCFYSFKKKN